MRREPFTFRVGRIRNPYLRRAAIVAVYPLMVTLGAVLAVIGAVLWFAKAQATLGRSAAKVW